MSEMEMVIDYLAKWGHFLAGITWIGLLYYFNFVQGSISRKPMPLRARMRSPSSCPGRSGGSVGQRCSPS